jgi:preprotein translocase subunit SecE
MSSIAKQDAGRTDGFLSSLLSSRFYKPSQGRIVRQVTFASIALIGVLAAWGLGDPVADIIKWLANVTAESSGWLQNLQYPVLIVLSALGVWIAFRLVNFPKFADFLISVEAEMNKVTWPGRDELWRASAVVIFVIFALAAVLFVFDVIWTGFFQLIRVRY